MRCLNECERIDVVNRERTMCVVALTLTYRLPFSFRMTCLVYPFHNIPRGLELIQISGWKTRRYVPRVQSLK